MADTFTLNLDLAAHLLDEMLAYAQAQPRASLVQSFVVGQLTEV